METRGDILVEVQGVSKKFSTSLKRSLSYGMRDVFSAVLGIRSDKSRLRKEEFWAVKDVSFQLRRGECLGLIGRNGAGKSTLLKMLNGLIVPDEGSIVMRGKVSALIELGAGFNPLLSGRENIYINGQLLGIPRKEIDEKLQSIIDFSEIEAFIDSPVQNYSSGMKVRLGFAVAAHMNPDVLIIDEVLAVGDLGFVLKCFNTIDNLLSKTAVIFVSHSMPQVSRICTAIMMLDKGREVYHDTDIAKGIDIYYSTFSRKEGANILYQREGAELLGVEFAGQKVAGEAPVVHRLDDLKIVFNLRVRKTYKPFVTVTFYDKEQRPVGVCMTDSDLDKRYVVKEDGEFADYKVHLTIPRINLSKGLYSLTLSIGEGFRAKPLLRVQSAASFQVISDNDVWQPIEFEGIWT